MRALLAYLFTTIFARELEVLTQHAYLIAGADLAVTTAELGDEWNASGLVGDTWLTPSSHCGTRG